MFTGPILTLQLIDGGRHLYIGDFRFFASDCLLDYQDPENKIEVIRASDATLTHDELIYALNTSPNSLGDPKLGLT